jgi:hypothetical protein
MCSSQPLFDCGGHWHAGGRHYCRNSRWLWSSPTWRTSRFPCHQRNLRAARLRAALPTEACLAEVAELHSFTCTPSAILSGKIRAASCQFAQVQNLAVTENSPVGGLRRQRARVAVESAWARVHFWRTWNLFSHSRSPCRVWRSTTSKSLRGRNDAAFACRCLRWRPSVADPGKTAILRLPRLAEVVGGRSTPAARPRAASWKFRQRLKTAVDVTISGAKPLQPSGNRPRTGSWCSRCRCAMADRVTPPRLWG